MRTGGCLCGSVRFEADAVPDTFIICHCELCRRWTGSALLGVIVPNANLHWTGTEHIAERHSTGWGKRAWCKVCGSPLYLQSTVEDDEEDQTEIPLGLFDDASGLRPSDEIWYDHKPDSYAFADMGQARHTRAECIAHMPYFGRDGGREKEHRT